MLFEYMGANDLAEVQVLGPLRWGNEHGTHVSSHGYQHECLETIGQNMSTFRLRGLEDSIKTYIPDILYVMEEPYTPFALQCIQIAEKLNIPTAVFTWENLKERNFGEPFDGIERDVIGKADIVIAGTEGARDRVIYKGATEEVVAVCPQTGINCELFKPMPEVKKQYACAYFGRMVKEKGVEYIENVAKEMHLKMLWIGGRGSMTPSYGDYIGWIDYLRMPGYYNKSLLFVTYPNSYNGFYEQLNYSIPEAMACGTPVISSTNGSIPEVYNDAPLVYAEEASETSLKDALIYAMDLPNNRIEQGIEWVHKNLSINTIADRLLKILKVVK